MSLSFNTFASTSFAGSHDFSEAAAWKSVDGVWRQIFGSYSNLGFSFEWHSFRATGSLDWARSFHPGSLELCLNLSGHGRIQAGDNFSELGPQMYGFYFQGEPSLRAIRYGNEMHQFITVEYSPEFLTGYLSNQSRNLHPLVRSIVQKNAKKSVLMPPGRLDTGLASIVATLRHPPVFAPAQPLWFQSKALELATHLFFTPPEGELFCTSAQRSALDRVQKAKQLLNEKLSTPPTLEELGKLVGCSHSHLSRSFSQETGMTISQYIRQIRMERAASLLQSGKYNVTETALEVGYQSLSHFSATFHETFGCCPGLYGMKISRGSILTPRQK